MKKYFTRLFIMAAIMAVISSSCEKKNQNRVHKEYFPETTKAISNEALVDEYIELLSKEDNNNLYSFSK